MMDALHPQLSDSDAALLAGWLGQQPQVVAALTQDRQKYHQLLKRSVSHAAVLRLLLSVGAAAAAQAPAGQPGQASVLWRLLSVGAAAAQAAVGQPAQQQDSSSTGSDVDSESDMSTVLRDLLLDVLANRDSVGDVVGAFLEAVPVPAGLLQGAAKVCVHPYKAAAVADHLPQLLELGLPPYCTVGITVRLWLR